MPIPNDGHPSNQQCYVSFKHGHCPDPADFHSHDYYEISLILSGHMKSMLRDKEQDGNQPRLILCAPGTPHLIFMSSPSHYARMNLYFEPDFIENSIEEWHTLSRAFGKNGNIINLSRVDCERYQTELYQIMDDNNVIRKKLRILALLTYILENDSFTKQKTEPFSSPIVLDAVSYINKHYAERIVAADLAKILNIGRTTLMTAIKKHTGLTLSDYVMKVRVKKAVVLLKKGISQEETAQQTGLGSGGGIIRAFRKCYAMTPGQYMKTLL